MWVTSMESSFTGKRCDVRKLDDVVDSVNSSRRRTARDASTQGQSIAVLTEPWGFHGRDRYALLHQGLVRSRMDTDAEEK